jgi:hypothetical protein
MDRLDALRALYAAVKDGRFNDAVDISRSMSSRARDVGLLEPISPLTIEKVMLRGSVDAALALIAATLPGWLWNIVENSATVWPGFPNGPWPAFDEYADTTARALLLACIAAHIAKEEEKG